MGLLYGSDVASFMGENREGVHGNLRGWFSSTSGGGLLYSQLLAEVPSGLQQLVFVTCGNDFYRKGRIAPYDEALDAEFEELSGDAAGKAASWS